MRQLLWEMEAWGEYEEIQSDKKKLKKSTISLRTLCAMDISAQLEKSRC